MDAHLVLVPGLGTLTVGGLTGGDVQGLGGQTDGTLDLQGLGAGTVDKLRADLLEGGDLARGKSDTDLVDLLYVRKAISTVSVRPMDIWYERTGPSPKSFSGFWKDILDG